MKIYREISYLNSEDLFGVFNYPDAQFNYPLHKHPEYELNLIMGGSGNRIVGEKMERYEDIDLVLLGPNLPHAWTNEYVDKQKYPQTHTIFVHFEKSFIDNPLVNKTALYPIKKMLQHSIRGFHFHGATREHAKRSLLKLTTLEGFDRVIEFLKLLNMLAVSEEKEIIASAGYNSEKESQECARMEKVYTFIKQHYNRKLLASEVAGLVNLSESAFSHFFKKSTNRSFSQYLIEIRISQACKLLVETQCSIREICFQCGYSNLSNFNRLFRKYKKTTPLEYRRKMNYEVSTVEHRFV